MKTIIFQKVGNEKIVVGFSECLIDLQATKRAAEAAGDTIHPVLPGTPASAKAKRLAIIQKHAVYFQPSPREKVVSNETWTELKEKHKARKEREVVTLEGRVLADHRGRIDHRRNKAGKLEQFTIEELGVVPAKETLTESEAREYAEQLDAERIAGMKKADKDAEKAAIVDGLVTQAALMRSKAEIKGETAQKALTDATAWYQAEAAKVEAKYK